MFLLKLIALKKYIAIGCQSLPWLVWFSPGMHNEISMRKPPCLSLGGGGSLMLSSFNFCMLEQVKTLCMVVMMRIVYIRDTGVVFQSTRYPNILWVSITI